MTVDEQLAAMSDSQLRSGLARGLNMLKMVQPIMFGSDEENYLAEEYDAKGPPSAAYERWLQNYADERERLLKIGIRDVRNELARRGIQP